MVEAAMNLPFDLTVKTRRDQAAVNNRLVTMFRAAKRSGRELVLDLYSATMAAATGLETIPQARWEGVRVFLPRSQKARILQAEAFDRAHAVRASRIYGEELRARAAS